MSTKLNCRKCDSKSTKFTSVLLWGNRTSYRAGNVDVQQCYKGGRKEDGPNSKEGPTGKLKRNENDENFAQIV